jgi:ATPase family associated with various cellular activities (AAA)
LSADWQEANQRYLVAALGRVCEALRRHLGEEDGGDAERELTEAAKALPAPAALDRVCASFGLSDFERDLLLLCAGVELDGAFAELCGGQPTFGLALAALPGAHWSALSPDGPLRRWRLVETAPGDRLTTGPLQIDERVLHYLAGVATVEDRLRGLARGVPVSPQPPSREAVADRVLALWQAFSDAESPPAVQLCGGDGAGRRGIAGLACAKAGLTAVAVDAAELPATASEQEPLARLWEREAALTGAALLLELEDVDDQARLRRVVAFLEAVGGWRLVSSREPVRSREPILRVDVPPLEAVEQLELWKGALDGRANADELAEVAQQFRLGGEAFAAAAARVRAGASAWDACREQARPRLDDLALRIEPAATWHDLVLPEPQLATLREVALHVRHRATVYDTWGFAAQGARGLGISALFAGPSGTGKTMAAEVLANELRLDLYRIDLSSVVSKYIGETEKNLRRVFDAAEEGGAILLFDEADALFGKRSEVKDSHDRYANIEVSYLLQRMEAYRGLAILTTNQKSALDQAFLRRLRFVVQFPFPDPAQRAEIWRRIFPAETPVADLSPERLAQLNVAGGNIRNIALGAAFLAAADGGPIQMSHLLPAVRSEYAKLEKPLSDTEIGGWE